MVDENKAQFAKDEDLERAKALWQENGKSIVSGIVIGLCAIGGYNFWQSHQKSQGEDASELFDQLRASSTSGASPEAIAKNLFEDYGETPYANFAAFYMAKISVESSDLEAAKVYLNRVVEQSKDPGMVHVARTRLASVYLAAGEAGEALSVLDVSDYSSFAGRYEELKGDAYAALGQIEEARQAYESSLLSDTAGALRGLIQLKLDNLGQGG
ncbi:MAG: tetratricopeptide repeat protein [Pseudomonadota bacterium]